MIKIGTLVRDNRYANGWNQRPSLSSNFRFGPGLVIAIDKHNYRINFPSINEVIPTNIKEFEKLTKLGWIDIIK